MSSFNEHSDAELIAACLEGTVSAWDALIERYRGLIYSVPLRYGFAKDDAEDIFQSVCVKLIEKLSQLRDQEKLASWLITTGLRECWYLRQRQRREISIVNLSDADEEWDPIADMVPTDNWLIELEQRHYMEAAYSRLSERCRQLLGYLFFKDPPSNYQQISAETGIPVNSIAPTRSRCLEKLKYLFDQECANRFSNHLRPYDVK